MLELVNNELGRTGYGETELSTPPFPGWIQGNNQKRIRISGLDETGNPIMALRSGAQQNATFHVNEPPPPQDLNCSTIRT